MVALKTRVHQDRPDNVLRALLTELVLIYDTKYNPGNTLRTFARVSGIVSITKITKCVWANGNRAVTLFQMATFCSDADS